MEAIWTHDFGSAGIVVNISACYETWRPRNLYHKPERLAGIKCFHAGGEAKWWLPEADKLGMLDQDGEVTEAAAAMPFVELTPAHYSSLQRNRRWLRRLGYYSVFGQ